MSDSEYSVRWKRDSGKPRPEDTFNVDTRREAVTNTLEKMGVDEEEYHIEPTKRVLGGELPYFEIAHLVLHSIEAAVIVKQYIEDQGDKAVLGGEMKQRIDQEWEEKYE